MKCVKCGYATRVTTTYQNADQTTKRRRECIDCGFRFTTREHPQVDTMEVFDVEETAKANEDRRTED